MGSMKSAYKSWINDYARYAVVPMGMRQTMAAPSNDTPIRMRIACKTVCILLQENDRPRDGNASA